MKRPPFLTRRLLPCVVWRGSTLAMTSRDAPWPATGHSPLRKFGREHCQALVTTCALLVFKHNMWLCSGGSARNSRRSPSASRALRVLQPLCSLARHPQCRPWVFAGDGRRQRLLHDATILRPFRELLRVRGTPPVFLSVQNSIWKSAERSAERCRDRRSAGRRSAPQSAFSTERLFQH